MPTRSTFGEIIFLRRASAIRQVRVTSQFDQCRVALTEMPSLSSFVTYDDSVVFLALSDLRYLFPIPALDFANVRPE